MSWVSPRQANIIKAVLVMIVAVRQPELILVVIGVPMAAVLHELTHTVAIWPAAQDIEIHWRQLVVVASIDEESWQYHVARLAGLAPLIIGVIIAVALFGIGRPLAEPWTPQGFAEWGIWICYTITGGVSDYLPSVSRQKAQQITDSSPEHEGEGQQSQGVPSQ
jgi:hypothetical protein